MVSRVKCKGSGRIWITNGRSNMLIRRDKPIKLSDKWWYGRTKTARSLMDRDYVWVNNGIINKKVKVGSSIEEGWREGRKRCEKGKALTNKIWITNGVRNLVIFPNEKIPDGWERGVTKYRDYKITEKQRLKKAKYQRENVDRVLLSSARKSAKLRKLKFNLELGDILVPTICPILKIRLKSHIGTGIGRQDNTPSLDRIDSSKGYVKGNVRVISWLANRMKTNATEQQLLAFAKGILRLSKSQVVVGYLVAKNLRDLDLENVKIHESLDSARQQIGRRLYKVKIGYGSILRHKLVAIRKNKRWVSTTLLKSETNKIKV
jgi:hypothetical protein